MKLSPLHWVLAGSVAVAAIIVLPSWQQAPRQAARASERRDTIPRHRDFDKELKEIAEARQHIGDVSSIDMARMEKELAESLSQLDAQKIELKAQQELRQLDLEKLVDINSKVDFDGMLKQLEREEKLSEKERKKVSEEIRKAQKQMERELKNRDWQKEIRDIDWKNIEKDLENAKQEMMKARDEIADKETGVRANIERAGKELETAEAELKGYQAMVYTMESDGLLSTGKDYTIEWQNEAVKINGKEQPAAVTEKFRNYFKKDHTLIEKKQGRINVRHF